ncbi:glycerophosphodiester phosphodiesterase [Streptomyces sp. WMMC905]|uniref:glycerophosphodiester phosphodiesterase n=1 Tax=Streptomyces sp. WMMC905 TaxID=3404123 RepID=UPI003B93DC3B
MTRAVGHRGDPYRRRENTLASLRSAWRSGADAAEVDVRLTRDRVPVLLHDATLQRLWGRDRPLASLSSAEVRELTAGRVPTLEEALAATEGRRLLLDLPGAPDDAAVRRIVEVVRSQGASDRVEYCAGAPAMLAVRAVDARAEIALTWTSSAPPRPALMDAVRPRWLNYAFALVDGPLVERIHHDGRLVSVWTPDTRRSMRRLTDAGVDSITTNRVDVLRALLERGPRQPAEPTTG